MRFIAAISLLLLGLEGAARAAAPAPISQLGNYSTNLTPSMSFTSGNTLVLYINTLRSSSAARTVFSVGSTNTTGWTKLGAIANGSMGIEIWYGHTTATATDTITVTMSGTVANQAMNIYQFSGVLTSGTINDGTAITNSGTSTSPTTTSFTVATAGDLVLSVEGHLNGTAPTAFPGGSYTNITFANSSTAIGIQGEFWANATAGATSASWTIGNVAWGTVIGGLKPATVANTASVADTTLSAETVSGIKGLLRGPSDLTFSAVAVSRSASRSRSASDTAFSGESVTTIRGASRTAADTSLSAEAISRAASVARLFSAMALSSESTAGSHGIVTGISDMAFSGEVVSRSSGFNRSDAASTISSESLSRVVAHPRSAGISAAFATGVSRVMAALRVPADTAFVSVSDTGVRTGAGGVGLFVTGFYGEAVTTSKAAYRSASSAPTVSVSPQRLISAVRAGGAIAAVPSPAISRLASMGRGISDLASIGESIARSAGLSRSTITTASVADQFQPLSGMFRSAADLAVVSPLLDARSGGIAYAVGVMDTLSISALITDRRTLPWAPLVDSHFAFSFSDRPRSGAYVRTKPATIYPKKTTVFKVIHQ